MIYVTAGYLICFIMNTIVLFVVVTTLELCLALLHQQRYYHNSCFALEYS